MVVKSEVRKPDGERRRPLVRLVCRFLAMALLCAMTANLLSAAAQASTGERTGTAQISTGVSAFSAEGW